MRCRLCPGSGKLFLVIAGLLLSAACTAGAVESDLTRQWVLGRLNESLSPPRDLDGISSMLFGLVSNRKAAEQADTRRLLGEVAKLAGSMEPARINCSDAVNLHLIAGFLNLAGMSFDSTALSARVQDCFGSVNPYDKASALYSLCRFDAAVPRERLAAAMASIEAQQQPDGSFGSGYGLSHFYTSTHAVFALHACAGDPLAIQMGQDFIRSALPRLWQAGFIDALMQSLLMLREMKVDVPEEDRYLAWLRSRIKPDGSICCFDRPGCESDRHATSQLLEFFRVFPASE
ncbi:MAG: hypothetical protein WCH04_06050 [Gammaproteobacteria bacterium]